MNKEKRNKELIRKISVLEASLFMMKEIIKDNTDLDEAYLYNINYDLEIITKILLGNFLKIN